MNSISHIPTLNQLIHSSTYSLLEAIIPFVPLPYKFPLVLYIKVTELLELLHAFQDISVLKEHGFCMEESSQEDRMHYLEAVLQQNTDLQSLFPMLSSLSGLKDLNDLMPFMDLANVSSDFVCPDSKNPSASKDSSDSHTVSEQSTAASDTDFISIIQTIIDEQERTD